jgi:hypothetical protein
MRNGLLAEFRTPEDLLVAARQLRELGYSHLDAFTPYPVPEVERVLGIRRSKIPVAVLIAGLTGATLGYVAQWWMNAVDYPIDVGGRPLHSAPVFVPITFESGVLAAALTGFVALLVATRLPQLWHPVFEVEGFERATIDRFWIGVDQGDPRFVSADLDPLLRDLGAVRVLPTGAAG